jgi:hypothetical protein
MVPLAVSGALVVGVVVVGAIALLVWLLRAESREEAEHDAEAAQRTVTSQRSD